MIYAIQCGREGPIKIGVAHDPQKRLADLQVGCPYELFLVAAGDLPDSAETEFHQQLQEHNVRGEWFHPSEPVWAVVREIGPLSIVGPQLPRPQAVRWAFTERLSRLLGPIISRKSPVDLLNEQVVLHGRESEETESRESLKYFIDYYNARNLLSGVDERMELV